ncbi:hypothetical protein EJ05DRAFT_494195 [Pseudovirgaria hyperparasitica]|uniref:Zn(2)-C6 fungal-type domain-containing protein n=1 Tax=Pseudovirgaria hyperparasitica TaxID=470096 RepID=A0A6A6VY76_9PEZI|nr:uncharacterized protein EJ05DRAFT_494195 [Pseudovirgaria hyperparasitica]KAF2755155.1 hypothetical protein EJ05DRAFT_494195 [Pseudovirgaria hyperparasitica]
MSQASPDATHVAQSVESTNKARSTSGQKEFQRAYKACIPCRKRKAKCDVPDAGPPCQRCRRELRECIFSDERSWTKKRKRDEINEEVTDAANRESDDITGVRFHLSPEIHDSHTGTATVSRPAASARINEDATSFRKSVMRTVVSNSKDALDILFQAAEHPNSRTDEGQSEDETSATNVQTTTYQTPTASLSTFPFTHSLVTTRSSPEVLKTWNACRFVRMGLFSAEEALTYVELFFRHMHPLSPILTDFYANHENHPILVTEEPVLCTTILMISSRYNVLEGSGGASRSYFIHHRLWEHLQHLLMKITLGQEKGKYPRTRNVGSIEALLLIVEWHPRILHFPPAIDGWDADLVPPELDTNVVEPTPKVPCEDLAASNKWLHDVIESVRRSDRMSWMLLGTALTLAHERGVFDDEKKLAIGKDQPQAYTERTTTRFLRTKKLLYVYTEQLSSRLGHTSMVPQGLNQTVQGRRSGASKSGDEWQAFMTAWIDLTKLLKSVSDMFFPSPVYTKQILSNGKYISLLEHFQPLLDQWRSKHLENQTFSHCFLETLNIEFQYVKVYMNSLGMQAVVERTMTEAESGSAQADASDYEFVQEVVDGSCEILERIISLAESGSLRYAPVRVFLRITSSSIFLIKGLSLGVWNTKLQSSLGVISRAIQSMRASSLDDMHLASRYATLLELHLTRLRRSFKVSSRPPKFYSRPQSAERTVNNDWNTTQTDDDMGVVQIPSMQPDLTDMTLRDDWLTLPFDTNIPPFSLDGLQSFPRLDDGTLDFIWNFPT